MWRTAIVSKVKKFLPILMPVLIASGYMLLCSANLHQSVWFDEAYSGALVKFNFDEIWSMTAADVHPPLYYFLLKIWSMMFGSADYVLRFLSVFFGALTIIIGFFLIRREFGLKTATMSSLALAMLPIFVRFGQEMRMYTMVSFWVMLGTYILVLAIDKDKLRYWLLYGLVMALGMWTHYFVALAWLGELTYLIWRKRSRVWQKNIISSYLLAIILFLPWLPMLVAQTRRVQDGFWIPPVDGNTIGNFISESILVHSTLPITAIGGSIFWLGVTLFVTLMILLQKYIREHPQKRKAKISKIIGLFWLNGWVPIGLLLLLSLPPLRSVFMTRYIIYATVFLWLATFIVLMQYIDLAAIWNCKKRNIATSNILAIGAVLLLLTGASIGLINNQKRPPTSRMQEVMAVAKPGEPILVVDDRSFYEAVFYDETGKIVKMVRPWRKGIVYPAEPIDAMKQSTVESLEEFTQGRDNFWVMRLSDETEFEERLSPLQQKFQVVEEVGIYYFRMIHYHKK